MAQESLSRRTIRQNDVIVNADALDIGGYRMTVLRSQLPRKPQSSPEWRQALQLLARNPRGTIEDVLELGHPNEVSFHKAWTNSFEGRTTKINLESPVYRHP